MVSSATSVPEAEVVGLGQLTATLADAFGADPIL
jgi:hypothetical protein